MSATETYIESEQSLELAGGAGGERGTQEMQDALSRYRPVFYRKAYQYLGNASDAEDVVQDALLSAYKHLDQYKGQAQMSTWLTAIVVNCARMHLRRRPRQAALSLDERFGEDEQYRLSDVLADATPSPEAKCRESELRRHLMQFVAELSPSLRKAFEVARLGGADHQRASASGSVRGNCEGAGLPRTYQAATTNARALGKQPRPKPTRTTIAVKGKEQQDSQVCGECPALLA